MWMSSVIMLLLKYFDALFKVTCIYWDLTHLYWGDIATDLYEPQRTMMLRLNFNEHFSIKKRSIV